MEVWHLILTHAKELPIGSMFSSRKLKLLKHNIAVRIGDSELRNNGPFAIADTCRGGRDRDLWGG